MMIKFKINNKSFEAEEGQTILEFCQKNGIKIPTLCRHSDLSISGVCRLCLVKILPRDNMVPACAIRIKDGMEIITEDEDIKKGRKINLELLWADHAGKCANCARNGDCELQDLACEYNIEEFKYVPRKGELTSAEELDYLKYNRGKVVFDDENPSLTRNSEYCIECRRCIKTCREIASVDSYGFNYRSSKTNVGTPHEIPLDCIFCGQCLSHCPTAAIVDKSYLSEIEEAIENPNKMVVVQTAPSVRFTLGEEFGFAPGEFLEGKMIAALRKLGFDKIFDTVLGADLTIMEEATELKNRLENGGVLPMFTSCCPSWVLFVEKYYPQFIPNLSTCRSPQQMLAPMIKTYWAQKEKIDPKNIVSVSVMPCTSKKYEAQREEMNSGGRRDLDYVMTIRELARLIKKHEIDFSKLGDEKFDPALGITTGAGVLFGASGGVMEAALRTAYEYITHKELPKLDFTEVRNSPGIKEASIQIDGKILNVAVVHESKNARTVLEDLKKNCCKYHFVEVMACPNGCIGGGGQPMPVDQHIRNLRISGIIERDKKMPLRKSHENPILKKLYDEFLDKPGSEKAEEFLHTEYTNRKI